MISIFKALFVMFLLNLAVTSVFGQKIIELRISGGKLVLSGDISLDGTTELGSILSRKVSWQIKDQNIVSFNIAPKNPSPRYPFDDSYDQPHTHNLNLRVAFLIAFFRSLDWEYKIGCTDVNGKFYEIDPKIAIKPGNTFLGALIALLITMFAGLFTIRSRKKRRSLTNNAAKNNQQP